MGSRLTKIQVERKLHTINPRIMILSEYTGQSAKMRCKCSKCGSVWNPIWKVLRSGGGCRKCAMNRLRDNLKMSIIEIRNQLAKLNPKLKVLSCKCESHHTKVKCVCLRCKHVWWAYWSNLRVGIGCPACYANGYLKSEENVRKLFENITGWKFPGAKPSDVPWLRGLTLDGFNVKHQVAFEYQGPQHYQLCHRNNYNQNDLVKQRKNDKRKRRLCKQHKVKLITIPYWIVNRKLYITSHLQGLM